MSRERYVSLVTDLCKVLEISDASTVIQRNALEVSGYEVQLQHIASDDNAMYLNFSFGIVSAGRTLKVFHTLLTSNLTLYAQDQAQLGLSPDSGGVLLIIRVPMTDEIDGTWLAETFQHYSEHGKYWKQNLFTIADQQYEGPPHTHYMWMRA